MQRTKAFVFTLVLVWIILKMVFFALDDSDLGHQVGILSNLLFILAVSAVTLWWKFRAVRPEDSNALDDLKSVMQRSGLYVLLVCAFMMVYYAAIDPGLNERRIEMRMGELNAELDKYENFEDFVKTQEMIPPDMTREKYVQKSEEGIRSMLNPWVNTGGSLLSLMMWAVTCAILVTLLFRTVLFK